MSTISPDLAEPAGADAVLAGLDPEQRAVATALTGPVCVLAGAGTGKTRAITHRIAYGVLAGVYAPQHVLAVTFTNRAAGELRGRLRALGVPGVQARTFHSAALRQLQYFWPRTIGGTPPRVIAAKVSLIAEAAGRLGLRPHRTDLRDLAAEVEWAAVSLVPRDGYVAALARAGRTPPAGLDATTVERLLGGYDEIKRERDVMDFEDVLLITVGLLAEHAEVAEAVRAQYRHFVVDEYQDVSPLQQQLLEQWLGGRDSLCVVGDPGQTIYSFAGATPSYLLGFRTRHPAATVVRLVRDYRSTPQVVGLANGVLKAGLPAGDGVELRAVRESGPAPTFCEYADEPAEAHGVAERIRALVAAGVPAHEIAVLFRTNGQSAAYEEALTEAGVPFLLRGGERFFERREVREAHLLLRAAARSGRTEEPLVDVVRAVLGGMGWSTTPPQGAGAARDRWESLAALVGLAENLLARQPAAGLAELVDELDDRAATAHAPVVDAVTLASLHAAKGLEWDAVFLVGLTEGMVPISYAQTPEAVAEECRLLYVGVTRAREHLALSWTRSRAPGGAPTRRPSRFLDGLRPADQRDVERAGAGRTRTGRRRPPAVCRVCGRPLSSAVARKLGRCVDCPVDIDEATFERLRAWRLERARVASVPAFVVFTDATLTAIAELRPTTLEALATVPGVGRTKLDRYGAEVLDLVGETSSG
ncbi:MAG TPA: ATP-dependent DNA helicase UvrD2 [Actinomycetes bacterium]|nr:ATP-dependent DNA helicase UvrD2 [Actinomycetes bacterium]